MGDTTTQTTTIPEMSPEEAGLMNLARDGLLTSYLEESGYDVTKTETGWDDSAKGKELAERRASLQSRIDTLSSQGPQALPGFAAPGVDQRLVAAQYDLDRLDKEEEKARKDFKPEINYETRKKYDIESERIGAQYGYDSPEYKEAVDKVQVQKQAIEQQTQRIQVLAMDATEKFLRGDYSINEDQKKFIDDTLGPVKEAGLKAVEYLKEEAGLSGGRLNAAADQIRGQVLTTEQMLRGEVGKFVEEIEATGKNLDTALGTFRDQVKATGMTMGDAVFELEQRTRQTGASMKQAFEETLNYSKSLTEMGIQDFSINTRNAIAQQATALGRSPTDPEFVKEMQAQVGREIQRTGLAFGEMAAGGRMGIEERTGAGLEAAGRLRLGISERTGAGLEEAARTGLSIAERLSGGREEAARMGLSIAERTGMGLEDVQRLRMSIEERTSGLREEAARLRGRVEVGAAESLANMRTQLGMSQVPQAVGLGLSVNQYQQAIEQQRLANSLTAAQAPLPYLQMSQQERMAQPTTVTKTSPGFGSIFGGLMGAGMAGVGTAASVGAFGPMAQMPYAQVSQPYYQPYSAGGQGFIGPYK